METQTTDYLEEVLRCLSTGETLDPELIRQIEEKAREIEERVFREHGLVDVGTRFIRELREE